MTVPSFYNTEISGEAVTKEPVMLTLVQEDYDMFHIVLQIRVRQ